MKFFFILILTLFFIQLSQGQTGRTGLELGIGFPNFFENAEVSGERTQTSISSWAISFSGVRFFSDTIGLGIYLNFMIPFNINETINERTISYTRSDYNILLGTDILLGPVFIIYRNGNFLIPVSIGPHIMIISREYKTDVHVFLNLPIQGNFTCLGIGANVTGELHLNNRVYLYGRIQLTMDFYALRIIQEGSSSVTDNSGTINFGVNPSLGIAVRFR